MILLDTHTLIWWVSDPPRLSARAKREISNAISGGGIAISAISVWEIALLVKAERIQLKQDVHAWIGKVLSLPVLTVVPVDADIAETSVFLSGFPSKDPADRIIIATAIREGATLVTSDKKILLYPHVQSAW